VSLLSHAATVARRLLIDVHNDIDNNNNKNKKNKEKTSVKYIALPASLPSGLNNDNA